MKSIKIAMLVILASTGTIPGQDKDIEPGSSGILPRVAALPIVNSAGGFEYDSICDAITKSLHINLSLLYRYDVVEIPASDVGLELGEITEIYRLDNVLFGSLDLIDETYSITLSVYDREASETTISLTTPPTDAFGVFDAADDATLELTAQFSGVHIGFGSLEIEASEASGLFDVYLDSTRIGGGSGSHERILNGDYTLSLRQTRFGERKSVHSESVTIIEGETALVTAVIPPFLPDELRAINEFKDIITVAIEEEHSFDEARDALNALVAYLETGSDITAVAEEMDRLAHLDIQISVAELSAEIRSDYLDLDSRIVDQFRKIIPALPGAVGSSERYELISPSADLYAYLVGAHALDVRSAQDAIQARSLLQNLGRVNPFMSEKFRARFADEAYYAISVLEQYIEYESEKRGPALSVGSIVTGALVSSLSLYRAFSNPEAPEGFHRLTLAEMAAGSTLTVGGIIGTIRRRNRQDPVEYLDRWLYQELRHFAVAAEKLSSLDTPPPKRWFDEEIQAYRDAVPPELPFNEVNVRVEGIGAVSREPKKNRLVPGDTALTLTAGSIAGNWSFDRWEGDVESRRNPLELNVESDMDIVAVFEPFQPHFELTGKIRGVPVVINTDAPRVSLGDDNGTKLRICGNSGGDEVCIQFVLRGEGYFSGELISCDGEINFGVLSDIIQRAEGYWGNCVDGGSLQVRQESANRVSGEFDVQTNIGDTVRGSFDVIIK